MVAFCQLMVTVPLPLSESVTLTGLTGSSNPMYTLAEAVAPTPAAFTARTLYAVEPISVTVLSVNESACPGATSWSMVPMSVPSRKICTQSSWVRGAPLSVCVGVVKLMVAPSAPSGAAVTVRAVGAAGASNPTPSLMLKR